jgi:hypothetical protein
VIRSPLVVRKQTTGMVVGHPRIWIEDARGEEVCSFNWKVNGGPVAQRFAASEDLLEALKTAHGAILELWPDDCCEPGMTCREHESLDDRLDAIRDAIDKAEAKP